MMEAPVINYMYNKKETHCQTVSELISTVVRKSGGPTCIYKLYTYTIYNITIHVHI